MIGKSFSTVGLVLDILGAWCVAMEVVKQFKGMIVQQKYVPYGETGDQEKTAELEDYERFKYRWMKIGLCLLTAGFIFQIVGLWI